MTTIVIKEYKNLHQYMVNNNVNINNAINNILIEYFLLRPNILVDKKNNYRKSKCGGYIKMNKDEKRIVNNQIKYYKDYRDVFCILSYILVFITIGIISKHDIITHVIGFTSLFVLIYTIVKFIKMTTFYKNNKKDIETKW